MLKKKKAGSHSRSPFPLSFFNTEVEDEEQKRKDAHDDGCAWAFLPSTTIFALPRKIKLRVLSALGTLSEEKKTNTHTPPVCTCTCFVFLVVGGVFLFWLCVWSRLSRPVLLFLLFFSPPSHKTNTPRKDTYFLHLHKRKKKKGHPSLLPTHLFILSQTTTHSVHSVTSLFFTDRKKHTSREPSLHRCSDLLLLLRPTLLPWTSAVFSREPSSKENQN